MITAQPAAVDPLTGLPTRPTLGDLHGAGPVSDLALLLLDVDRFGQLNDSFGPRAGDDALRAVAARLSHAAGPGCTVFRWGGDEFAVLCRDGRAETATALAGRLLDALEPALAVDDRPVRLDASIGMALAEDGDVTLDALIRDAGVALCRAKAEGGARWRRFDPAMRREVLERAVLEHELGLGIERGELVLFFQPVVALDDHRIVGLETLVRWRHPERGLLSPAAFLPVAQESALIVRLGRWVLTEACRTLARWSADPELADVALSVNIAGRQLADPRLADDLADVLQRTGVAADRLVLELSETELIGGRRNSAEALQRLLDLGVGLALDDFGAGWTSMTHLRHLPIEALKVDRSFVAGITEAARDRHVFGAIVELGRGLGVTVIAAGVETAEQAACVAELGCVAGQGYFFAPPVPAKGAEALLRDGVAAPQSAPERAAPPADPLPEPPAPQAHAAARTVPLGEAAEALGVSTSTLRRWADAGRVPSERTPGGHRRFAVAQLGAFRSAMRVDSGAVVREAELPPTPLPGLGRLLGENANALAQAAVRVVYEPSRRGWFATEEAIDAVRSWTAAVAAAVASGDHAAALPATARLLRLAELHGASLLERHAFLERHGDVTLRALQRRGAAHAELVGAGRVLRRLQRVALEDPER